MTLIDEFYRSAHAAIAVIRSFASTPALEHPFARDRTSGEIRVSRLNPRFSRSSALASKADRVPISPVAAKLAVVYPSTRSDT